MAVSRDKVWKRIFVGLLFIIYLAFLVYLTVFAENWGRAVHDDRYRYNLTLFREIKRFYSIRHTSPFAFVSNVFGNVLAFMPFGFLLPKLFEKCKSVFTTVGYSFLFSLGIETIQLIFKVGCFDIDDLLLNTIGGLLGFVVAFVVMKVTEEE